MKKKFYEVKEPVPSFVNEAALDYGFNVFSDKFNLVQLIRKGIDHFYFEKVKSKIPFNDQDWSDLLNISTKSMHRYSVDKSHVFKPIHTEKIIEMEEVGYWGLRVFDTMPQFESWLKTPSMALGHMSPIELMKDSYGKELVLNELQRIDEGIFS